jgi:hypothetical protein
MDSERKKGTKFQMVHKSRCVRNGIIWSDIHVVENLVFTDTLLQFSESWKNFVSDWVTKLVLYVLYVNFSLLFFFQDLHNLTQYII